MDTENESNPANRTISTGKLHALRIPHPAYQRGGLPRFSRESRFEVGFPLRCFPVIPSVHSLASLPLARPLLPPEVRSSRSSRTRDNLWISHNSQHPRQIGPNWLTRSEPSSRGDLLSGHACTGIIVVLPKTAAPHRHGPRSPNAGIIHFSLPRPRLCRTAGRPPNVCSGFNSLRHCRPNYPC